jgi:hypothetical protein
MLKKVMFAMMAAIISTSSLAGDEKLEYKLLSAKESEVKEVDNIKISVKDQKGGVFVVIPGNYPKTTALIRELMKQKGIKVVEDPATADFGIQFKDIGGIDFDDIEEYSSSIDASGVLKFLAFGLTSMAVSQNGATFMAIVVQSPTVSSSNKIKGENRKDFISTVKYEANKKGPETDTTTLVNYVNHFIEQHFVFQ